MTYSLGTIVIFVSVYFAVLAGIQAVVTNPILKKLDAVAEILYRIEEKLR